MADEVIENKVEVAVTGRLLLHATLEQLEACDTQRDEFRDVSGNAEGVVLITEEWVAAHMQFDYMWCVERLLSEEAQDRHCALMLDDAVLPDMQGTYEDRHKRYAMLWARCYILDTSPVGLEDDNQTPVEPVAEAGVSGQEASVAERQL